MIRHKATINGIEIEAVYSEQTVNEIFLPLALIEALYLGE